MDNEMCHKPGISIEWCPLDQISLLQEFIDANWKRGHVLARDANLLRWQNAYPGDSEKLSVLIAHDAGTWLGMLGVIQVGVCVNGERISGAWLTSWLTLPESRSEGLGRRLMQEVLLGFEMVGGLGGNDLFQRILGASGFDIWDSIPRWVRVINPSALESLLGWEEPSNIRNLEERLALQATLTHPKPTGKRSTTLRVVDWSEDAAFRWDQAWKERIAPCIVGTWRDAEYLRWRYLEHPRFDYVLRLAEDSSSGALRGLLVYRIEAVRDRLEKVIRVVEFLCDEAAGSLLSAALIEEGEDAGVAFADFYCTSRTFAESLEKNGFLEETLPNRLPELFQPLEFTHSTFTAALRVRPSVSADNHAFFRSNNLYFTRSDSDQDRPN